MPARRDDEAISTEGSARDVSHELHDADATRLALLHIAENMRTDGPRRAVLEQIASRRAALDDQHITNGTGIDRSEAMHYAQLFGIDYSILRTTFDFLGRQRVPEDELRTAAAYVGSREV